MTQYIYTCGYCGDLFFDDSRSKLRQKVKKHISRNNDKNEVGELNHGAKDSYPGDFEIEMQNFEDAMDKQDSESTEDYDFDHEQLKAMKYDRRKKLVFDILKDRNGFTTTEQMLRALGMPAMSSDSPEYNLVWSTLEKLADEGYADQEVGRPTKYAAIKDDYEIESDDQLMVESGEFYFECDFCGKEVETKQGMSNHLYFIHEKEGTGISDEFATRHVAENKPEEPEDLDQEVWSCDLCGNVQETKAGMGSHLAGHHDIQGKGIVDENAMLLPKIEALENAQDRSTDELVGDLKQSLKAAADGESASITELRAQRDNEEDEDADTEDATEHDRTEDMSNDSVEERSERTVERAVRSQDREFSVEIEGDGFELSASANDKQGTEELKSILFPQWSPK